RRRHRLRRHRHAAVASNRPDEARQDEAEEARAFPFVAPAEVRAAVGAQRVRPGEAGEPGELRRRLTVDDAPRRPPKAADLERHAGRVDEAVAVRAADVDARVLARDARPTGRAPEEARGLLAGAGAAWTCSALALGRARLERVQHGPMLRE